MLPKLTGHGSHFVMAMALTLDKLALSCHEHSIGFVLVCTAIVAFGPIFYEKAKKILTYALQSNKYCNNLPLATVFGLRSSCGRLGMGGFDGRCKNDRLSSNYLLKANVQE